jgi:hypothetical protein
MTTENPVIIKEQSCDILVSKLMLEYNLDMSLYKDLCRTLHFCRSRRSVEFLLKAL